MINRHYDDCFFSDSDGYNESKYVFIDGNSVDEKIKTHTTLKIGETGFGSGLNLLLLEDEIERKCIKDFKLCFTTVEKYPIDLSNVKQLLEALDGVTSESFKRHCELYGEIFKGLKEGWNSVNVLREWGELEVNLFYGDVLKSFLDYPYKNDSWFLDGHSPDKNSDMWNVDVFRGVATNSVNKGTFATFTAAGIVKQGLRNSGFFVKRKKGYGRKRHMILGYLE